MTKIIKFTNKFRPDSTAIDAVYYDKDFLHLYVRFHNGRVAGYGNVLFSTYHSFATDASAGRFYNENIIHRYPGLDAGDVKFLAAEVEEEKSDPQQVGPVYTVTYEIRKTVTETVEAASYEEAVSKVARIDGYAGVKKVEITFG